MPFVIATEIRASMQGGSENPAGTPVKWYFLGGAKWTRDMGRAKRYDDSHDAAMAMVLLHDALPNQKFSFLVVDQLPLAAEAAGMDPAELDRLRLLAREFKEFVKSGYEFKNLPAPHEPRIYKIGEKQCQCRLCVERLIGLFPDLQ